MIKVLVDGRIDGHDEIGRYTRCLVAALREQAGPEVALTVLHPTGTARYSRAEGEELLRAARACAAVRADRARAHENAAPDRAEQASGAAPSPPQESPRPRG